MKKAVLLLFALFTICCSSQGNDKSKLVLVDKKKLKLPEPSGLTLSTDGKYLWTVSDDNKKIYKLSLKGKKVDDFKVGYSDLEGITELKDGRLAVVVEEKRKVIFLDDKGRELKSLKIDVGGEYNKGLEGIAFNPNNNHLFVANEKYPVLIVELDENFKVVREININFVSDLSGLYYEKNENVIWIVSDESNLIAKTDLQGNLIESWNISLNQIEGIAVDYESKSIFLVSDAESRLFHFKLIE